MRRILALLSCLSLLPGASAQQELKGDAKERLGACLIAADFDGDGIAEVLAGAPRHTRDDFHYCGRVAVIRGGSSPIGERTTWLTSPISGAGLGTSLAVGDVNGDGTPDLLVGAPGTHKSKGAAFVVSGKSVIAGGSVGTTGHMFAVDGSVVAGGLGTSVALGDLDGDGLADIVVAEPGVKIRSIPRAGRISVYRGRRRFRNSRVMFGAKGGKPDLEIIGRENEGLGVHLAVADVNGDGIADLITGSPFLPAGRIKSGGSLQIFLGKKGCLKKRHSLTLGIAAADREIRGSGLGRLGVTSLMFDIDADGTPELLIAEPDRGRRREDKNGAVFALPRTSKDKVTRLFRSGLTPRLRGLAAGENFGSALASARVGDRSFLVVGSPAANRVVVYAAPLGDGAAPRPHQAFMGQGSGRHEFGAALAAGPFHKKDQACVAIGAPRASTVTIQPIR